MSIKRIVPFVADHHFHKVKARHVEAFEHGLAAMLEVSFELKDHKYYGKRACNRESSWVSWEFLILGSLSLTHYGAPIENRPIKYSFGRSLADSVVPKRGVPVLAPISVGDKTVQAFAAGASVYPGKRLLGVMEARWETFLKSKKNVRQPGKKQIFFPETLVFEIQ